MLSTLCYNPGPRYRVKVPCPTPRLPVPSPWAADGKGEGICWGSTLLCKLPGAGEPDTKAKRLLIPWQAERGAGRKGGGHSPFWHACAARATLEACQLPVLRPPRWQAGPSPASWPGRTMISRIRRRAKAPQAFMRADPCKA